MRNDDGITPQQRELEAALASLTPAPASLDRDRLMFAAGRVSVRHRTYLWQGMAAMLAVLLTVSVVAERRPAEGPSHLEVVARTPAPEVPLGVASLPTEPVDRQEAEAFRQYMRTRRAVLDRGVDALPVSPAVERRPVDPPLTREDIQDLLSST